MDTWENPSVASLYVGEPAAIKAPTSIRLRRQAGANVLVVGQNEQESLGILCAAMTAAAAQQSPERAMFCLFDGAPADSSLHGQLEAVARALPHASKRVEYRKAGAIIDLLHQQLTQRQQLETTQYPSIYVLIAGMQR